MCVCGSIGLGWVVLVVMFYDAMCFVGMMRCVLLVGNAYDTLLAAGGDDGKDATSDKEDKPSTYVNAFSACEYA